MKKQMVKNLFIVALAILSICLYSALRTQRSEFQQEEELRIQAVHGELLAVATSLKNYDGEYFLRHSYGFEVLAAGSLRDYNYISLAWALRAFRCRL